MPRDKPELERPELRSASFVRDRPSVAAALELARGLQRERVDLDHAIRVATMVDGLGYEEDAVAAALLQAVAREHQAELGEVEAVCGHDVGNLVAALVDDSRRGSYEQRKAEERDRIARSDRVVAAIYAADQLDRIRAVAAAGRLPSRVEFRHYQRAARALSAAFPGLPFVAEMRFELGGLTGTRRDRTSSDDR
jgi:(p)ppGpp synthase/HD superfamily hydrolase